MIENKCHKCEKIIDTECDDLNCTISINRKKLEMWDVMLEALIEIIHFYKYDYENFEYLIESKIKPLIEKATDIKLPEN